MTFDEWRRKTTIEADNVKAALQGWTARGFADDVPAVERMRLALTRIRRETVPGSNVDMLAKRALEGK